MNSKSVKLNYNFDKYLLRKHKKGRPRLTVCIAAINNGVVIGASDRMVTAGDVEFEPPVPKILTLTSSIALLTAGDQSIQMQVFQKAYKIIAEKIAPEPLKWIDVSYAAEVYSKCFYDLRNKMIENSILSPYNLTFDSFIKRQKEMSSNFIDEMKDRIRRFIYNLESIETIIAGIDNSMPHVTKEGTSPHIYVVKDGEITCHDKLGFVSIGYGSNHAESHLMLSNYNTFMLPSSTLLAIHQAKKKSEVCPGVGKETDMFLIGGLGKFGMLNKIFERDVVKELDDFYNEYEKEIEGLNKKTEKQIEGYFNKLTEIPESKQESGSSPSPSPSSSSLVEAGVEVEKGD